MKHITRKVAAITVGGALSLTMLVAASPAAEANQAGGNQPYRGSVRELCLFEAARWPATSSMEKYGLRYFPYLTDYGQVCHNGVRAMRVAGFKKHPTYWWNVR